ncbi:DNA-binding transcriptional regulator, MarR family [Rathayibacter oskolensis]|uniref:DNA-binding transcriptional regulator, MarR family n=1 Tax=Rathayibacter oskolensis TaxID=1891671 RepID=A0A1X7NL50_9MICO|nr:MarR family winged helix-turn-helix transcriptional regulator [Rathayibacter oskolensis]SMH38236.1 DNA-binding transcriptional regulator, MarR family [Rathayibacter oskolensis]
MRPETRTPQGVAASEPAVEPLDFGPLSQAIIRLGRAHRALATQLMGEVGLHPDQGALMMYLWSVGPVRQTVLATRFGKDSASTTRTVQRLEHAGYVRRRVDPTDRRATLVEPTAAGNALRDRVEAIWGRLEAIADDGLTVEERELVLPLLLKIGDAVSDALTSEPSPSLRDI